MRSILGVVMALMFVSYIPTKRKENNSAEKENPKIEKKTSVAKVDSTQLLYEEMQLAPILKYAAFEQAMQGYQTLKPKRDQVLTVIDFTLPSSEKRMVVLDMEHKKVLFHSLVSHGKNSGDKYARSFSNRNGSHQSSLGFFETEGTYQGGNGYSLVLNGLEKGINDQAKARAVVVHGANYCSEDFVRSTGRLGRSYGCPALPRELTKPIINTIKNGSLLFIYANNPQYMASTKVVKNRPEGGLLAQHSLASDSLGRLN